MPRTTILIPDDLMLEVKRVAHTQGTTLTEIIKGALRAYVETQPRTHLPSFTAVGRSHGPGSSQIARNAEKLVRRAVDPHEGSAHAGKR
jgi:hypothetical protein